MNSPGKKWRCEVHIYTAEHGVLIYAGRVVIPLNKHTHTHIYICIQLVSAITVYADLGPFLNISSEYFTQTPQPHVCTGI